MLAQRRLQKDLENLKNDLNALMIDAKDLGSSQVEGQESLELGKTTEQFQQIVKRAEETLGSLRQQMKQSREKVGQAIEKHPFAAIGTALGVGFALGKLLNLRKSSSL